MYFEKLTSKFKAHWKVSNLINKKPLLAILSICQAFLMPLKHFISRLLRHHKIVYIELISTRVEIGISAQFDLFRIFANWSFFYIDWYRKKVYDLRCQFSIYSHISFVCGNKRWKAFYVCRFAAITLLNSLARGTILLLLPSREFKLKKNKVFDAVKGWKSLLEFSYYLLLLNEDEK